MEPVEQNWQNRNNNSITNTGGHNNANSNHNFSTKPKMMPTTTVSSSASVCSSGTSVSKNKLQQHQQQQQQQQKQLLRGSGGGCSVGSKSSQASKNSRSGGGGGGSGLSRLYRAPQPSIRSRLVPKVMLHNIDFINNNNNNNCVADVAASSIKDKTGNTRRRRTTENNNHNSIPPASSHNTNTLSGNIANNSKSPRLLRNTITGGGFALERQHSDHSLNPNDVLLGSCQEDSYMCDSDADEQQHYNTQYKKNSNNHDKIMISGHASLNDLSLSSRKDVRNASRHSTTSAQLRAIRSNGGCSRTIPSGHSPMLALHHSYSDHIHRDDYDDDDSIDGIDSSYNFQSDILFVESGGVLHSNSSINNNNKQPLYKNWLKTMRSINAKRRQFDSKKYHSSSSFCRSIPLRVSCYINNLNDNLRKSKYNISFGQLFILTLFGIIIFDARMKIHKHKTQIQQYDEERAHILEQMTWIDRAAKRVHNNYYNNHVNNGLPGSVVSGVGSVGSITNSKKDASTNILLMGSLDGIKAGTNNNHDNNNNESIVFATRKERDSLREELDNVRAKIQTNARDRNHQQFGDKPIQVSLPILPDEESGETNIQHLVIALWDDTPHAASTLLQQINKNLWDAVDFQRVETSIDAIPGQLSYHHHRLDCIQITPKSKSISVSPSLEFVEKSRGCHHPGSVAIRQLESDDFHLMVLKVHITEESHLLHNDEGDVCIGTVVSGLDALISKIPKIPVIHMEDDDPENNNDHSITNSDKNMGQVNSKNILGPLPREEIADDENSGDPIAED